MFNCNCRWAETIFGVVILIVTIWPGLLGASASMWVVIVVAALLVIHAWTCANCCSVPGKSSKKKK